MKKTLLISTLLILALTGCSITGQGDNKITIQAPVSQVKPARPAPFTLENENWERCGNHLCVKISESKKVLRNKTKVNRWMGQANAVINYYETQPGVADSKPVPQPRERKSKSKRKKVKTK